MTTSKPRSRSAGRTWTTCVATLMLAACGAPPPAGAPAALPPASRVRPDAATERILYSFSGGNDGGNAATGLVRDSKGNLYGTTVVGGAAQCGAVFELRRHSSPPWPETVLYSFTCYSDGKSPHGGVTFDSRGNLDGTTASGGVGGSCGGGCGVVFSVTPPKEKVLHDFTGGADGFGPGGGVAFDSAGNAYGTTPDGGASGMGVVYEIPRGGGEKVLHAFAGGKQGGVGSLGLLLLDKARNLYGVTEVGGAHSAGTVFKLSHAARKGWKLTTLYAFAGEPDAGSPYGGVIADAAGNLYGTTYYGGADGAGAVFELTPNAKGRYRERVLYSFTGGADGSSPTSTLIFAKSGELLGTASAGGGSCGCGTVFEVDVKSGHETTLHVFSGATDGAYPYYGLTAGANGTFYGTTVAGGIANQGTVFEVTTSLRDT